jgi:hypothetical protein
MNLVRRGVLLAGCSFVFLCCEPDLPKVTTTCTSSRECPLDSVCQPSTASCTKPEQNVLIGRFRCTNVAEGASTQEGIVDALAGFDGVRMPFAGTVSCRYDNDPDFGKELTIYMNGTLRDEPLSFEVSLDPDTIVAGGEQLLELPKETWGGKRSGTLVAREDGEQVLLAAATGAFVTAEEFAVGQPFSGTFELTLTPSPKEPTPLATACTGIIDCSSDRFGICTTIDRDGKRPICSLLCGTPERETKCQKMGGVCSPGGTCALACSNTKKCPTPLECGDFGEASLCY